MKVSVLQPIFFPAHCYGQNQNPCSSSRLPSSFVSIWNIFPRFSLQKSLIQKKIIEDICTSHTQNYILGTYPLYVISLCIRTIIWWCSRTIIAWCLDYVISGSSQFLDSHMQSICSTPLS